MLDVKEVPNFNLLAIMRKILCSFIASAGVLAAGSVWAASGDGVINTAQGLLASQTITAPMPLANLSMGNGFMPSVMGGNAHVGSGPMIHRQAEAVRGTPEVASHAPAEDKENGSILAGLAVIVALVAKRISG